MADEGEKVKAEKKTLVSFRFSGETMKRIDALMVKPPPYMFHPFRGNPRTKTELIELLIGMVADEKLQPVEPTQTTKNQPG